MTHLCCLSRASRWQEFFGLHNCGNKKKLPPGDEARGSFIYCIYLRETNFAHLPSIVTDFPSLHCSPLRCATGRNCRYSVWYGVQKVSFFQIFPGNVILYCRNGKTRRKIGQSHKVAPSLDLKGLQSLFFFDLLSAKVLKLIWREFFTLFFRPSKEEKCMTL